MRPHFLLIFPLLALVSPLGAQESEASPTEKLKDSIREWIETNREIQKQEDDWDRDREVLTAHRDGLRTEIEELKQQIEALQSTKGEADKKSLEMVETHDKLKAANELKSEQLVELEKSLAERLPAIPPMLMEDPRVEQMVTDLKLAVAKGADSGIAENSRLNNVLNLMASIEQFQGLIHSDNDAREVADGRKLNIKMVYFGLSAAYGVDESGEVALVGKPGSDGWVFEERNDLAPRIKQLVDVMNGDEDAKFVTLPIELP
ncbi:MAG: DUF3450 family protein [Verrucomicrobiota bacterium]